MEKRKPSSLLEKLKTSMVFFGPGLLLAVTAAGETGIADGLEIGAHYGLSLTWIVLLTLIFKYAFTTGIARYTLATGETIFQALPKIPGPKNWAAYFTIFAYIIEAAVVGSMVIFAATFLDYLLPGAFPLVLIELAIILLAFIVLRTHIYHHFEMVMAVIVLILSAGMILLLFAYPSISSGILPGLVPSIPTGSESIILCILGVVGSGLTLMLYSVWLEKKIRDYNQKKKGGEIVVTQKENKAFFNRYLKSIKADIILGFIIVALITIGSMAIGYLGYHSSFIPASEELSVDLLISMLLNLVNDYSIISYIILVFFIAIFFGAIVIGLDARASAITKIIKGMREVEGKPVKNTSLIYNICFIAFLLLIIPTLFYNKPLEILVNISMFCAIVFGIFGFILIYLNSRLPAYARGNRLWILLIGIGSAVSIIVALILEGTLKDYGLPLVKELALVLVVIFLICRSKMFKRLVTGISTITDKIWIILLFGCISIAGIILGLYLDGSNIYDAPTMLGEANIALFTFGNLGPIIAGIIGGPVIGGIVGIFGGVYHLTLGGPSAIPYCIITILSGIISGFILRAWKGKLTLMRSIILSLVVECLFVFSLFPTFMMATGSLTATATLETIIKIAPTLCVVTTIGVVCFWLFSKEYPCFVEPTRKFSFSRIKKELKELTSKDKDEEEENR